MSAVALEAAMKSAELMMAAGKDLSAEATAAIKKPIKLQKLLKLNMKN